MRAGWQAARSGQDNPTQHIFVAEGIGDNFVNESGDPGLDWLRLGILFGVSVDLSQDLFMTAVTADAVREFLAEAGFDLTDNIPLSLKREAAERRSLGHFMDGGVQTDGDGLVVETRLYETRNARRVATRTASAVTTVMNRSWLRSTLTPNRIPVRSQSSSGSPDFDNNPIVIKGGIIFGS